MGVAEEASAPPISKKCLLSLLIMSYQMLIVEVWYMVHNFDVCGTAASE